MNFTEFKDWLAWFCLGVWFLSAVWLVLGAFDFNAMTAVQFGHLMFNAAIIVNVASGAVFALRELYRPRNR